MIWLALDNSNLDIPVWGIMWSCVSLETANWIIVFQWCLRSACSVMKCHNSTQHTYYIYVLSSLLLSSFPPSLPPLVHSLPPSLPPSFTPSLLHSLSPSLPPSFTPSFHHSLLPSLPSSFTSSLLRPSLFHSLSPLHAHYPNHQHSVMQTILRHLSVEATVEVSSLATAGQFHSVMLQCFACWVACTILGLWQSRAEILLLRLKHCCAELPLRTGAIH